MKEVIRKYEKWVILSAVIVFIGKMIYLQTGIYDTYVKNFNIEEYAVYNHFWNAVFPLVISGIFVYLGWIVFHYAYFQTFKENILSKRSLFLLLLVLVFIISGIICFYYLKLFWRLSQNGETLITFSKFRKFTVFKYAIVILVYYFLIESFFYLIYSLVKFINTNQKVSKKAVSALLVIVSLVVLFVSYMAAQDTLHPIERFKKEMFTHYMSLAVFIYIIQEIFYQNFKKAQLTSIISIGVLSLFFGVLHTLFVFDTSQKYTLQYHIFGLMGTQYIFLLTFGIFLIATLIVIFRNFIRNQSIKLQTQIDLKSAELDQLRGQVNPHFLFNALNSLYSVSLKENAQATASGIQKLGDMMRFMLNENNKDLISLEKEIQQLENYITIQRIRIDETHEIKIVVNIQKTQKEVEIAPMLLNPFVENAFKHGISLRNPSWIFITLTHDADTLYFKVHNSLHKNKEIDPEKYNNGIGLENVKKRLELLYPERHSLKIQSTDHDFFVSLNIKY